MRDMHPLRKARKRLGYTQEILAGLTKLSKSSIERAESGKPLSSFVIQSICGFFSHEYERKVTPEELGLVDDAGEERQEGRGALYTDEENGALHETESGEDVDRREAMKKMRDIGLTLVTAPHVLLSMQPAEKYSAPVKLSPIDDESWDHFKQLLETCWHLSKGNVLEIVEPTLWAYLPRLAAGGTQPSGHQRIAAELSSQGYLLAAILAGHRDDLHARQRFCEQALAYANLAEDCNLQVAALRQLALTFDYKDRPGKAFQTYQGAIPLLGNVSPLLRSRMYAGLAYSHAKYRQTQEALRCLGLAYENFPEKPEQDPTFFYADCGYFTLILWDGLTHLDLEQAKEAEKAFGRVDGLHPKINVPERVRIEFLTYQAETFTHLRTMDAACDYLEEAVKASLALGSERRYSQASEVYQQMCVIWRHESRIRTLGDVFTG